MNQWRKVFMPIRAAVAWSRAQSCSGGLDLRKYTAPYGKTGSAAKADAAAISSAALATRRFEPKILPLSVKARQARPHTLNGDKYGSAGRVAAPGGSSRDRSLSAIHR